MTEKANKGDDEENTICILFIPKAARIRYSAQEEDKNGNIENSAPQEPQL